MGLGQIQLMSAMLAQASVVSQRVSWGLAGLRWFHSLV